jgi:hypothetical protein
MLGFAPFFKSRLTTSALSPITALNSGGCAVITAIHNAYADHIGTVRVITKQDHAILWRWDAAETFGATAPNQDPSGLGSIVYNPTLKPGSTRAGIGSTTHAPGDTRK